MGLTFKQKYSFGIGALGKDLCYAIVSSYLMIYFTDAVGLAPMFVGNLFLVARLWDAVNDPAMGMIVDNTRTKWGKFRPWILIGTLINAVVLIFLFRKPGGLEGTGMYAYYSVMYILWGMTYTIMDIPYWSMLPSLSNTKEEREQMSVIPRIFASTAWMLMGAFGLPLVAKFGQGNDAKGYSSLAVVVSIIFVITTLITVINVQDRSCETAAQKHQDKISVRGALHVIGGNDQLKVYIGVVLAYNLVVQLAGGMAIYYFKYVVGNENYYPIFVTAAAFAEIGALAIFPAISKKLTRKQVFFIASILPAVGLICLIGVGMIAPQNIVLIAICGVMFKLGSGFTLGATTVMLADVIDYGEVKLGTRNESIIASFQTLLVKTASAVAGWLIGVGLTVVGFVANAEQSATTIAGMRFLTAAIPSIVTILAFIIYAKGYKLQGEYHDEIMRQLNEKRANDEIA